MSVTDSNPGPEAGEVLLAVDVGGFHVKTAIVGPGRCDVERIPTATPSEPWSIDRLAGIVAALQDRAVAGGSTPTGVVVAVPGRVDEYHGAVQYSATLPWHDVAVADRLAEVVDGEVTVRHAARVGALAESNLGAAAGEGTLLYVSLGAGIVGAGAQSGTVVADHVGAGDLGSMRIRSGAAQGALLDSVASGRAIEARYAELAGIDPAEGGAGGIDAAAVHARIGDDPVARRVWDEAVDALADALEWSVLLFGPQTVVIGGGLTAAGADLLEPLVAGITRRLAPRAAPAIVAASFGADSGWVGAALVGWRARGWSIDSLRRILSTRFTPDA